MKDLLLKVVKSPAVQKAAVALIVAILGALGLSLVGCSGSVQLPPLPPEVTEAAEAGLCVQSVLADVDPEVLTLDQARELAAAVKACVHGPSEVDAGL